MTSASSELNGPGARPGPTFEWRAAATLKLVAAFAAVIAAPGVADGRRVLAVVGTFLVANAALVLGPSVGGPPA
jgi:hypothetical protein